MIPDDIFDCRHYGLFGWLADVRNYSVVPPISQPRGLPLNASRGIRREFESWGIDAHSESWPSADELLEFDYDAEFEDRRGEWWQPADPGSGEMTTYRDFLGSGYFDDLETLRGLRQLRPTRVVFWFDN